MTVGEASHSRPHQRRGGHYACPASGGASDAFLLHLLPRDSRPPDALLAETRRHLKGCIDNAAATLLRELAMDVRLSAAAEAVDPATIWQTVERFPDLLDRPLLDHMRGRATVRLLTDAMTRPDPLPDTAEDSPPGWLDDGDGDVARDALALLLARGRWSEALLADAPMPLDLPADIYAALLWVAATPIARTFANMVPEGSGRAIAAVDGIVARLIARYDEERGPYARARRLAHRLAARPDARSQAAQALDSGDLLLLAALAERDLGAGMDVVLALFWESDHGRLAALMKALHCTRPTVGKLMHCVALVSAAPFDLLSEFDAIDADMAAGKLADLGIAPALAAHLSLLDGPPA